MSYIALFATANTVLIAMIVGSRMLFGMARDNALPKMLARIDEKTGTPQVAIAVFMTFSIMFLFLGEIDFIANVTSLAAFLTFGFVNMSLLVLRFKSPHSERPFRAPINIANFPVPAFVGLISSIFMLFQFKFQVVVVALIIISFGLVMYWVGKMR